MYINKALIYGNLTRDPELKSLPSGNKVCSFGVATNRVWKDQSGAKKENTEFHNVVVFGRQAETTTQYLHKGNSVFIEGRLQTRSWDGPDGAKRYRTEIVADRVQFGPKGGGSGGNFGGEKGESAAPAPRGNQEKHEELETIEYPEEDIDPKDIPF